jgi:hypothetical protein
MAIATMEYAHVHNITGARDSHVAGALPRWPNSQGWRYYPSGGLGLVLIVLIVVMLMR